MAVLLLPGILLGKLAQQLNSAPMVQTGTQVLLLAGVVVWIAWRFMEKRQERSDEALAANDHPALPANTEDFPGSAKRSISELTALCGEDKVLAEKLVLQEMQVDPELTYSKALDLAIRRRIVTLA